MSRTQQPVNALDALKPKTKASRFRFLLPVITAKVREGVGHADIILALREQGLDLTEGTYFNYLQRSRKAIAAPRHRPYADERSSTPGPPPAPSAPRGDAPGRPPTFDYDPRGIPELLK